MSTHSEVVLAAWGMLAIAMLGARVLDGIERRRLRRLGARAARVPYRPPSLAEVRALYRAGGFGRRK